MKTLDLHGMRHEDARKTTASFIDRAVVESSRGKNYNIEIITGHSKKMQDIVVEVLEEYKVVYFIGGYLGMNPAVITAEIG